MSLIRVCWVTIPRVVDRSPVGDTISSEYSNVDFPTRTIASSILSGYYEGDASRY